MTMSDGATGEGAGGTAEGQEVPTVEALQAALAETEQELARRQEAEHALLGRYRLALVATEPAIPPELVTGDSVEAIDASFEAARELAERIRGGVRAEAARQVPAGAPGRVGGGVMSAFEKIRAGLAGQRG